MIRCDIEIGDGIKIVLLRDQAGAYIRLLANANGKPTFLTPKVPVTLGALKSYTIPHTSWRSIEVGNYELALIDREVQVRIPTWRTVSTDRTKFTDLAESFLTQIEIATMAEERANRNRRPDYPPNR